MREILFKAKRESTGEWVEGFYAKRHGIPYIYENRDCPQSIYEINPDTLCQYTGLTDKNGRKIWENDIVKHYNVPWEPAQFTKGVVYWNGENLRYERSSEYTPGKPATVNSSCVYEVIGNAFDNPELLEKVR